MNTAIVTGANGFIGSHIVARLLAQGVRVHALGRSTPTTSWRDRLSAAICEAEEITGSCGELRPHEVDLHASRLCADAILSRDDRTNQTTLFHVAGDTRFAPPDPAMQRVANVDAAINVLHAFEGRVSRVVHVSTAFVAGNREGLVYERELECGQGFYNPYEETKFEGERAVVALCRERGIPLTVIRPGIITNDRRTGRASTVTHFSTMIELVWRLQRYFGLLDGQVVSKRLRLRLDPAARPNLAPVDSIVPILLHLAASPAAIGRTFHLCHPNPQSNVELVELTCESLHIDGAFAIEFMNEIDAPTHTEEIISRMIELYEPYLNSRCQFDVSDCRGVVPDFDDHFSRIDAAYVKKIVEFKQHKRKVAPAQIRQQAG